VDTRFRCYRGSVSGFRGFRNPRQTGKQRDARGQMTREAPFRRRGCRYAPRTSRDARRAFFNASNVFFSEKYGEPRRACTTDPSRVRSHCLFQSTRSKCRRRFREESTISESRAAVWSFRAMWQCPSKTSGARRAAALGGSRARALRYVQVEEDSRHDEPSPRRGRRDGISRGTRRGGPHAQRRGGGASRDLSRSRVWAHALPRARGLAPLAAGHRGGGREEDLVPVLPGPRGRGGGRGEPLGDARRAVVVRYDQARGPTVREELAVPGNRRVARVRASLAHAPDARARGAGVRRLVKDAHRAVLAPRARYAAARTTPRRRGDANVTPEERPEKPRADARRGRPTHSVKY